MTATFSETELDRYVAEVATHLGDLPEADRAELLDDLRQHLAEVAAEDDTPLTTRLGPPAAYAAELLASAGLQPTRVRPSLPDQVAAWWRSIEGSRAYRETRAFLPELRPAWWVLRAGFAVYAVAVFIVNDWERTWPVPDNQAINEGWLLVPLAAAVVVSVRLGRRPQPGRFALLGNVVVIAAMALAVAAMHHRPTEYVTNVTDSPPTGVYGADGHAVTNIYPFDRQGRPLDDVLLYDQQGQPIEVHPQAAGEGIETSFTQDARGIAVTNAYPLEQVPYGHNDPSVGRAPVIAPPPQAVTTTTSAPPAVGPAGAPPS